MGWLFLTLQSSTSRVTPLPSCDARLVPGCASGEVWSSPATVVATWLRPWRRRRIPKQGEPTPDRSFMDRSAEFGRWKAQSLRKADLSRKGSVDEDAVEVVELLNSREEFFTTSSCAGRILLLDGVRPRPAEPVRSGR